MKKFYSLICAAALASMSANAQKGNLVFSTPALGIEYQVTSLSPNGKWACGLINDGAVRGFLWNLTSGEMIDLSTQGSISMAMKVTNDGTVVGTFETTKGTPNNVPTETYGVWKNGKWSELEIENKENGTKILRDGYAQAISQGNGNFIGGIGATGDDYYPVFWKNGKLEVIDNVPGSIYDISDDGKTIAGWTTHPTKNNRTCVIWTLGEDGKYKKTCTDLESQWSAGPFCVANDISSNGRYVMAFNRVWDMQTGKYVEHDFSYAFSGFELNGVTNKGVAYGFHDTGEWPAGPDRKAIKVGLEKIKFTNETGVEEERIDTIDMKKFMIEKGVDLSEYPYVQRTLGISDDENTYAFYAIDGGFASHCIIVKLNVDTTTMAPHSLKAHQLEGVNTNRLSWKAPLKNTKAVKGYNVYRNGQKLNTELLTTPEYVDNKLVAGEYTYAVSAVYESKESEKCDEVKTTVAADALHQPLNLIAQQSSLNDVRMLWEAPYSNLPAIKYFNHDEVVGSLGGGNYSFEAAITARQSELAVYKNNGYKISQISFVPKSAQKSWTVKFYTSDNDDAPIYSEVIPNEGLVYGIENFYTLKTPLTIPEGKDLIMSIDIDATGFGGYDVIGIAPKKSDPRYSDLIRQKGEPDFYSMYDQGINSEYPVEYHICWAIGMHFAKGNEVADNAVKQYIVSANGKVVGNTTDKKYRLENLEDGAYNFEVVAEYTNGQKSAPASAQLNLVANNQIFRSVIPQVVTEYGKATATWTAPVDNDAAVISFANDVCSGGLIGSERNQFNYAVATRYKGDKLQPYGDFEITGFRFFPLCDAEFTFILKVNGKDVTEVALANGEGYVKNQWNTVKLEEPIQLNRYDEYTLVLDCYDVEPKKAPVGLDAQPAYPNVSDLYSQDGTENFKSLFEESDKDGNWMIGLEVAAAQPKQLPVTGYDVMLDNKKQNETPLQTTEFVVENLKNGPHQLAVNTIYANFGVKKGKKVTFVINVPSGIESLENTTLNITKNANTIEVKGGDVTAVEAINMAGAVVAKSDSNILDITSLTGGVYVLKIKSEGKVVTTKININK